MAISRRAFMGVISGSTFLATLGAPALRASALPEISSALKFDEGVASGDPRSDSVMLWTRAVPVDASPTAPVLLQVSDDDTFDAPILETLLEASAEADYTVRTYIDGLEPGRHYFFRFVGGQGTTSRLGRTMTARAHTDDSPVNLGFASCQSYEQAYYGSWARMLEDDKNKPAEEQIEFVLHLGDFIYERSWHKRLDGGPQSRYVPPFPDGQETEDNRHAVSLADYRHLYKTYLRDPHLQEARARWPFLCIWDDHEFSNNCFQAYSTYGEQPLFEPQRKLDANQAWFEFIPAVLSEATGSQAHDFASVDLPPNESDANAAAVGSISIYRRLRWGAHIDIFLTDTRSYRSEASLPEHFAEKLGLPMNTVRLVEIADGGKAYNNGSPPAVLPYAEAENPAVDREPGTCLGLEQREWFLESLSQSTARWKLWGNALPLLPLRIDMSTVPMAGFEDSVFSIDPWAGYPYEMTLLLEQLREDGVTGLVSLSGDHHMHAAGAIHASASEPEQPPVCVDFSVAGISSTSLYDNVADVARRGNPGFQPLVYTEGDSGELPTWNMTLMQGVLASMAYDKVGIGAVSDWLGPNEANPGLSFVDTTAKGYGLARFGPDSLDVSLVTMPDLTQAFDDAPLPASIARFSVAAWEGDAPPVVDGPEFSGEKPFPFSVL